MKGKGFGLLGALCVLTLGLSPSVCRAVTFSALADLSAPGSDIQVPGQMGSIPVTSTNHKVTITGGTSGTHYNIQITMHIKLDGETLDTDWGPSVSLITLDANGEYTYRAKGTGSMSQTRTKSLGNHTAEAYTDFVDNNNSANNRNKTASVTCNLHN